MEAKFRRGVFSAMKLFSFLSLVDESQKVKSAPNLDLEEDVFSPKSFFVAAVKLTKSSRNFFYLGCYTGQQTLSRMLYSILETRRMILYF